MATPHKAYDVIIAGSGFSGAAAARLLAEKGLRVLLVEQRKVLGGSMYDYDDGGILVHKYGPHIFHTNIDAVYNFLSRFTEWFDYKHKVLGSIDGRLVPIPFNFTALETLFSQRDARVIKDAIAREYGLGKKIPIMELKNNANPLVVRFAEYIYDKVFHNYTLKQWGMPPAALGQGVMGRVPVAASYEPCYFADKYQCMPKHGYTALISKMLEHPNIGIKTGTEFEDIVSIKGERLFYKGKPFGGIAIYTGCVDKLLNYKFGRLPYRSLKFKFETINAESYQPAAVVNYPNKHKFTRITEFSKFTKPTAGHGDTVVDPACHQTCPHDPCPRDPIKYTIIVKEYPLAHEDGMIPYYPIETEENKALFKKYEDEIKKIQGLYLLGRLAEYKYINMDIAVHNAISLVNNIE